MESKLFLEMLLDDIELHLLIKVEVHVILLKGCEREI